MAGLLDIPPGSHGGQQQPGDRERERVRRTVTYDEVNLRLAGGGGGEYYITTTQTLVMAPASLLPPAMVRLVAFTTYGMNLTRTICVGGLAGGTRIYYGFSGIV